MGGTSLPTASTPGYGSFTRNGRTFVACDCLREWLPVVERLGILRGLIVSNLDVVQLTGKAVASAGVHAQGGAFDVKQRSDPWIALFRDAGAEATWRREGGEWVGNEHAHGALSGCPHNAPVAYQITAARRGYNGLGQATSGPYAGMWGYGGRDPHPAPKARRDWRSGLAWAKAEIARFEQAAKAADLAAVAAAEAARVAAEKEFLVSLSPAQQSTVLDAARRTLGRDPQRFMLYNAEQRRWAAVPEGTAGARPSPSLDTLDGQTLRLDIARVEAQQAADTAAVLAAISALGAKAGTVVDVAAITAAARAGAEAALAAGVDVRVSVGS